MSLSALIRSMAAAGAPAEAIALAVEAIEAAEGKVEAQRAAARERKARQRAKSRDEGVTVTGQSEDGHAQAPETKVSPTPPSKTQTLVPPSPPKGGSSPAVRPLAKPNGFARFWEAYPNKTGKRAAEAAFAKAAKRIDGDPLAAMLPALQRAKQGRQWREGFVPNPTTWLNQDRWLDGVETAGPEPPKPITAAEQARRERHLADTGEWPDHWGERPRIAA